MRLALLNTTRIKPKPIPQHKLVGGTLNVHLLRLGVWREKQGFWRKIFELDTTYVAKYFQTITKTYAYHMHSEAHVTNIC